MLKDFNYMNKTLIIAEAGVNHNGEIKNAIKLIEIAAEAGADLVKFQTFNPTSVVTSKAPKAEYQIKNTRSHESQLEMIKRLHLSYEEHKLLIKHCKINKIGFFSTAFDLQSLDMLVNLGLQKFKIPSGEITNFPLIKKIAQLKKEVKILLHSKKYVYIEAKCLPNHC